MRALTILVVVAGAAQAYPKYGYKYNGLAIDLGAGVAIPTADSNYTRDTDVSFKLQIDAGFEIPVHERVLVAPELSFGFIPVNTDDGTFQNVDASFQRYRFLVGGRIGIRLGRAVPFLRIGIGVDHIAGKISVTVPIIGTTTQSYSSTAFVFEPAIGVNVEVVKYLFVGMQLGFPVAGHDFGKVFGQSQTFTAFDVEIIGFIGARY